MLLRIRRLRAIIPVWGIVSISESISGLTAAGSSVISEIEQLPSGLLFWRSLSHWYGGMGILVIAIAVLPFLGTAGYQLLKTEAPALDQTRLFPRIQQTVHALFATYVVLTVTQTLLVVLGRLEIFTPGVLLTRELWNGD